MITDIKKGDRIYLKPEWMDAGDETITFEAAEDHNGGNTILMADRHSKFAIRPTSLVYNHMIKGYE